LATWGIREFGLNNCIKSEFAHCGIITIVAVYLAISININWAIPIVGDFCNGSFCVRWCIEL
jgi:hypothetical protein